MWRRGQRAAIKLCLVNEVSDTSGKVLRPKVSTTQTGKVSIRRNIAVAAEDGVAIVPFGIDNNVRFFVTSPGEHVSQPFSLIIGSTEIGVAIAEVSFDAAKLVNQRNVN